MGVPGVGVSWGLAPTGGRRPAAARARCSRPTCAARACAGRTERGERELTVGRGTVPGGGAADRWGRLVSGCGGERGRAWAGPRRKWGGRAEMNSKVLHLFELV
jgi:hypothetical protein